MLKNLRIFETDCTDPYRNLATEKYLLEHVQPGECILYLWQNKNTVVIGRNQNPWTECRTSLLAQEGGLLARRLSGGGAVYHDLGNLNFTFLTDDEHYDLPRQLSVIQAACQSLGIIAVPSGRNDLLVEDRKFSGNAFYHSQGRAYHHGTILINADMDKLSRYLSPPKAKLEAKGVSSVRSRVTNLIEFAPGLTCGLMQRAMKTAFSEIYSLPTKPFLLTQEAENVIAADAQRNGSWQWLFGTKLPFSFQCEAHFPWGHIHLQLSAEGGYVHCAKVYSDAMDWSLPALVEQALTGCKFGTDAMCSALFRAESIPSAVREDLCNMLKEQEL